MRARILPYKPGSESARAISRSLGVMRLKHENSRFRPRQRDVIINWGHSRGNQLIGDHVRWMNHPNAVGKCSNKLRTFQELEHLGLTVPFTTNIEEARMALMGGRTRRIFCRQSLNGHSGEGIVVARTPEEVVNAPLYTHGIPKETEYRIHVSKEFGVFDSVEKKARQGARELPTWNSDVRSYNNGWVFAREGSHPSDEVLAAAVLAVEELGLDFGAVDICTERNTGRPYVLEINSSPALQGTTLERYTEMFRNSLNRRR